MKAFIKKFLTDWFFDWPDPWKSYSRSSPYFHYVSFSKSCNFCL